MSQLLLDAAGRRRPPATLPGFHAGRPPLNTGRRYPADPPTIEEIVAVMRQAGDGLHGADARIDRRAVARRPSYPRGAGPRRGRFGLRHVAFKVDDVRGVVDRVREAGWDTVGEIVDFENTFLLCYVRGPEGLIVELAQRLDGAPG
jgi:catechol 2,3-dioxygenase-like lactoylglutathione lyase family enzyme